MLKKIVLGLVAVVPVAAMAQTTGTSFTFDPTGTIAAGVSSNLGVVATIGLAVVGLCLVIAASKWAKRAL